MLSRYWCLLGLIGVGLSSACSPSNDDDWKACGGDVVGTWKVNALTLNQSLFATDEDMPKECANRASGDIVPSPDFTYVFTSDTATARGTMTLHLKYSYTRACLLALTKTEPSESFCASLERTLDEETGGADPTATTSCSFTQGGCSCTVNRTLPVNSTRSYSTSGGTITIGEDEPGQYCVAGNTLTIHDEEATMELSR